MSIETLPWLLSPPTTFRQQCAEVSTLPSGVGPALMRLSSFALSTNQLIKLSRTLLELTERRADLTPLRPFKLGLVSNATTDFIIPAIVASGIRHGLDLKVFSPPFGQVMQAVNDPHSALYAQRLDAILVALDQRGLGLDGGHSASDALSQIKAIRDNVSAQGGPVCIFQTLARTSEPLQGSLDLTLETSTYAAIQKYNSEIVHYILGSSDILLDVSGISANVGLARWHDPVMWHTAKLPFSLDMVPLYADHVARLAAALVGKSRKCLVMDLDNTIWGGVIGDDGLEGIRLGQGDGVGEAFLAVQRHALQLSQRGIILAVCSKNDDAVAARAFREHPEMLLREEHIATFQANWVDKAENLRAIATTLNIGLDSLVFLDDNPAERAIVRQELPQVAVPELPPDPAYYPRILSAAGYFDQVSLSAEDTKRTEFYRSQAQRTRLEHSSSNIVEYLHSLDMILTVGAFDPIGRGRIAQLINKTNQFNLTTRRYTEADVARIEQDPEYFTAQARLVDTFGDNGMISVLICRRTGVEWEVDTWLMSCRVLGRRVEQALTNILMQAAAQAEAAKVTGQFIPTGRNELVRGHYKSLGFEQVAEDAGTTKWYRDVDSFVPFTIPMKIELT